MEANTKGWISTIYVLLLGLVMLTLSSYYIWNLDNQEDIETVKKLKCHSRSSFDINEQNVFGTLENVPDSSLCQAKFLWHLYALICFCAGLSYLFFIIIQGFQCKWEGPREANFQFDHTNFYKMRQTERSWACQAVFSNFGYYTAIFVVLVAILAMLAVAVAFIPLSFYVQEIYFNKKIRVSTLLLFALSPIHFVQLILLCIRCNCRSRRESSNPAESVEL